MNPANLGVSARRGLACALVMITGCGYGPVSHEAYRYAQALVAITNRQAADRLDGLRTQVEASQAAGDLSHREALWLLAIAEKAARGDWDQAQQSARQMMEDQVQR
ncbi:hypothetical protein Pla175_19940 [Pirellulimonas nuda]|uniref:Uncharacterized protein n=1 Tax=Pirellulimonas nuda TaxID=2528009 RepID=A0A518DAV0_9BACT|nr:hypothetical protein [Pirellulimonas nuda]QDU88614.1 hypothetical protein Pla175_19940 [Pirellulimonas nuda]